MVKTTFSSTIPFGKEKAYAALVTLTSEEYNMIHSTEAGEERRVIEGSESSVTSEALLPSASFLISQVTDISAFLLSAL